MVNAARKDVMRADWNNIARMYWDKVYKRGIKTYKTITQIE